MPVCPKCGKEIGWLDYCTDTVEVVSFYIDEKGRAVWGYEDHVYHVVDVSYRCPECGERLFYSFLDAKKFLKKGRRQHSKTFPW